MTTRAPTWRYLPLPAGHPGGCLHCQDQAGPLVKVLERRTWVTTLCAACAVVHQRDHAVQLSLWGGDPHATP